MSVWETYWNEQFQMSAGLQPLKEMWFPKTKLFISEFLIRQMCSSYHLECILTEDVNSILWTRDKKSNFRVYGEEAEMIDIHKNTTFRLDFLLRRARVIGNSCKMELVITTVTCNVSLVPLLFWCTARISDFFNAPHKSTSVSAVYTTATVQLHVQTL